MPQSLLNNATSSQQRDPTHTTALRNAVARDMAQRFARLRGVIRRAVVTEDVFGLRGPVVNVSPALRTPGRRAFDFGTSSEKVDGFMNWVNEQVNAGILQTKTIPGRGVGNQPWTNLYVGDSYKRGVHRARREVLRGFGTSPPVAGGLEATLAGNPFHADRLGLLYTRTFNDLKGITATMEGQMSRVLAQGMADGDNPATIARLLNKTISGPVGDLAITDTLGRFIPAERRARMLARTEIIRAHHAATIQEYRQFSIEGVIVQSEWTTAGDDRVCAECEGLEGRMFTINEIDRMIPLHPFCRCVALPVIRDVKPEARPASLVPRRLSPAAQVPTPPPAAPVGGPVLPRRLGSAAPPPARLPSGDLEVPFLQGPATSRGPQGSRTRMFNPRTRDATGIIDRLGMEGTEEIAKLRAALHGGHKRIVREKAAAIKALKKKADADAVKAAGARLTDETAAQQMARGHQILRERATAARLAKEEAVASVPAPPPPRNAVERMMQSTPVAEKKLGGGINVTKIVEFEDGTKGVFKPWSGEASQRAARKGITSDTMGQSQWRREVFASDTAKRHGFDDLVPTTVRTEVGGQMGSVQTFQKGTVAYGDAGFVPQRSSVPRTVTKQYDSDARRSIGFDWVMGNTDRHMGNWMVESLETAGPGAPMKRISLIDNGLIMSEEGTKRAVRNHMGPTPRMMMDGKHSHSVFDSDGNNVIDNQGKTAWGRLIPEEVKAPWRDEALWQLTLDDMADAQFSTKSINAAKKRRKRLLEADRWQDIMTDVMQF